LYQEIKQQVKHLKIKGYEIRILRTQYLHQRGF
jgi:hypothetical protein